MKQQQPPGIVQRGLEMARLTILIDPHQKAAFDALCASMDLTTSQVVRSLIADFLRRETARSG